MEVVSRRWKRKIKGFRKQHRQNRLAKLESLEKRQLLTAYVHIDSYQDAAEPGSGYFRLVRDDSVSHLQVEYTVSGTATSGTDYEPLSGQVYFQPGESTIDIPVNVYDDEVTEGDETVSIQLQDACVVVVEGGCVPAYYLGSPSAATLTIAEDDFDQSTYKNHDVRSTDQPVATSPNGPEDANMKSGGMTLPSRVAGATRSGRNS